MNIHYSRNLTLGEMVVCGGCGREEQRGEAGGLAAKGSFLAPLQSAS